jgi:5-methylcytosine-specific restriction endonuclease McrA
MGRVSYYQSLSATERTAHNAKHHQKAKEKKIWPFIFCAECDAAYIKPEGYSYRYCSKVCKNKFSSRRSYAQRRMRINKAKACGIGFSTVYKKSGGKCVQCGVLTPAALRGSKNPSAPEIDHILPIACGGAHIEENLQIMCRSCNAKKGARLSRLEIESLSHLSVSSVDLQKLSEDNLHKPRAGSASGHKGVSWHGVKKKWMARVQIHGGKRITIGYFTDKNDAGEAAKTKRMELYCNG